MSKSGVSLVILAITVIGEPEGDDIVALLGAEAPMSTGRDHDQLTLLRVVVIGHRRCLAARGQASLPQLFARLDVKCAQVVVHRSANEDQSARRHDRSEE